MSHVPYEWVMAHVNESCHIWHTRESHIQFIREYHMNESCPIWMSQGTYEWVMAHMTYQRVPYSTYKNTIWMSHVTQEWVMSHMNESCHIWHIRESHIKLEYGTLWHIYKRVSYEGFVNMEPIFNLNMELSSIFNLKMELSDMFIREYHTKGL